MTSDSELHGASSADESPNRERRAYNPKRVRITDYDEYSVDELKRRLNTQVIVAAQRGHTSVDSYKNLLSENDRGKVLRAVRELDEFIVLAVSQTRTRRSDKNSTKKHKLQCHASDTSTGVPSYLDVATFFEKLELVEASSDREYGMDVVVGLDKFNHLSSKATEGIHSAEAQGLTGEAYRRYFMHAVYKSFGSALRPAYMSVAASYLKRFKTTEEWCSALRSNVRAWLNMLMEDLAFEIIKNCLQKPKRDRLVHGVVLPNVRIATSPPLVIGGRTVSALLGMDYISIRGGIHLDIVNGKVAFSFNDRPGQEFIAEETNVLSSSENDGLGSRVLLASSSYKDGKARRHKGVSVNPEIAAEVAWLIQGGYTERQVRAIPSNAVVLKEIQQSDFTLKLVEVPADEKTGEKKELRFVLEPKFHDGMDSFEKQMPAAYGFRGWSEELQRAFQAEIDKWKGQKYIVPVGSARVKHNVPLLAVEQYHKPTTPVRPCLAMTALNEALKSFPWGDGNVPASIVSVLRQIRASTDLDLQSVDVIKAYMQIWLGEEFSLYTGVRIPTEGNRLYRMLRMPFGLHIACKALPVALNHIFENSEQLLKIKASTTWYTYVDDIFANSKLIPVLREELSRYGFDTKEPMSVDQGPVLGLLVKNGQWTRRNPFPQVTLEGLSGKAARTAVASGVGNILAMSPVLGAIRVAAAQFLRIAVLTAQETSVASKPIPPGGKGNKPPRFKLSAQELATKFNTWLHSQPPVGGQV